MFCPGKPLDGSKLHLSDDKGIGVENACDEYE